MDERSAVREWTDRMARGDFAGAWRVSDAMLERRRGAVARALPRHVQPVWDGSPVEGKRVLVRCYHGLGDTLHFIRYAAPLRALAAEVSVFAQRELIPLLRTARGIDRLIPLHDGEPEAEREVEIESMELPHLFRTTLETIPADVPYLHPPRAALRREAELEVGLAWRAGRWDHRRSIPFALIAGLGWMPGVRLHLIQRGEALEECPAGWGVRSGSDRVLDTASLMRSLDLVISVDSMPAHLAGALGVPTWLLLHADADWRWMRVRQDSPWYPSMRIFRQSEAGDWSPVVERVMARLEEMRDRRAQPAATLP
jgi:hypothetical protein